MILLDTTICIHVINARPQAVLERFRHYRMGEIGVCSVVAAELATGVAKSGSSRNRQALGMFLAPLEVLPFDEASVWAYGDLRAELERKGTPIGALDTMIAAHALSQKSTLVTNMQARGSALCIDFPKESLFGNTRQGNNMKVKAFGIGRGGGGPTTTGGENLAQKNFAGQ